jgi:hypothetical protein
MNGYITYLVNPDQHTNAASSWPGYGDTREESQRNAKYWANQQPWVRTVPLSRAPRWAIAHAKDAAVIEVEAASMVRTLSAGEAKILDHYYAECAAF